MDATTTTVPPSVIRARHQNNAERICKLRRWLIDHGWSAVDNGVLRAPDGGSFSHTYNQFGWVLVRSSDVGEWPVVTFVDTDVAPTLDELEAFARCGVIWK